MRSLVDNGPHCGYHPEEEKLVISARRDKEVAGCNSKLTVEHTLSCKKGGLVHIHHDDVGAE